MIKSERERKKGSVMAAKILLFVETPLERLLKKHPLLLMIIMQIITALSMLIIVSGIALTGCGVIYVFYKLIGIM